MPASFLLGSSGSISTTAAFEYGFRVLETAFDMAYLGGFKPFNRTSLEGAEEVDQEAARGVGLRGTPRIDFLVEASTFYMQLFTSFLQQRWIVMTFSSISRVQMSMIVSVFDIKMQIRLI